MFQEPGSTHAKKLRDSYSSSKYELQLAKKPAKVASQERSHGLIWKNLPSGQQRRKKEKRKNVFMFVRSFVCSGAEQSKEEVFFSFLLVIRIDDPLRMGRTKKRNAGPTDVRGGKD